MVTVSKPIFKNALRITKKQQTEKKKKKNENLNGIVDELLHKKFSEEKKKWAEKRYKRKRLRIAWELS